MSRESIVEWWNKVAVGDKLRLYDFDDDKLLHVIAVFDDNNHHYVVVKEWLPSKQRWNYRVHRDTEAMAGLIYRDGHRRPE